MFIYLCDLGFEDCDASMCAPHDYHHPKAQRLQTLNPETHKTQTVQVLSTQTPTMLCNSLAPEADNPKAYFAGIRHPSIRKPESFSLGVGA